MRDVLVDSSVWIAFERRWYGLRELLSVEDTIILCPVIATEVLRGVQNAGGYAKTQKLLTRTTFVDDPTPRARFEEAAQVYLQCRRGGVTPSTVDCLIAASAIAHELPLLTFDADFEQIARYVPLRLFTRS